MKKLWLFSALMVIVSSLIPCISSAVCPVCTVAVGAGLEGARLLGVDDVLTGIWAGGLTLSLIMWTASFMHRHGIRNVFWYIVNFVAYYIALSMVYFMPRNNPLVHFNRDCIWGIDRFMLGTIIGTVVFYTMARAYVHYKNTHGGHALFPFQKVVMPFGGLLITTLIFWIIIELLPSVGINLC